MDEEPTVETGPNSTGRNPGNRERLETRLDALVRDNRFTIAVVFPVIGAVTLVASALDLLPPVLAYNPFLVLFGTLVMRLPLFAGLLPVTDQRAALSVVLVSGYAYAIEYVGVKTGLPYGTFEYAVDLGPMLLGAVPVGLPVFFIPLVLNSYLLVLLLLGDRAESRSLRTLATLATVLLVDLVLDPAAVAIEFWAYQPPGAYYGVPASNYAGWVLSGTVAVVAFDLGFDRERVLERLQACEFALDDMVSFVLLWGGINALFLQAIPVGVAALLFAGLVWTDRFDFAVLGGRVGRLARAIRR
jgi:putative membrane protein